jgi:hypothetical protein
VKWFKVLVSWLRSPEVDKALRTSQQRLDQTQKEREKMQPELDTLHRHVERNHFERSVERIFRVVD